MSFQQPTVPNTLIPVTPVVSTPAPPPVQNASQSGQSAFDAHLQHAHRHHARASSSRTDDTDQAGDSDTSAGNTTDNNAPMTGVVASGSNIKVGADKASDDVAAASLADTVLGLIAQAPEESGSSAATAETGTAANKPPLVLGQKSDDTPIPFGSMLLVGPPASGNIVADGGAGDSLLSSAKASGTGGGLFAGLGKVDDAIGSDATDDSSAGDSFAAVVGGLSALNATPPGQEAISTTFGTPHSAGAIDSGSVGSDATSAIRDLSSLHNMLGTQGVAPSLAAQPIAAHNLTVNAPVNSPGFSSELVQQVAWLGGQDIKQAKILLHPQDLGQLNVNVSIAHGKVDVVFLAQHPNAVAAVQQSLDQLSQMLNNQGLSLGQATVGQQGAQQHSNGASSGASAFGDAGDDGVAEVAMTAATQRTGLGLVDAFA